MTQSAENESTALQATDYGVGGDTLVLWSTPILRRVFGDSDGVNAGLKHLVLERAGADDGDHKSNVGGWHSRDDLLTWGGDAVATLQSRIVGAFRDVTAVMTNGQVYDGILELNAWANVNRTGDYNSLHTHPACAWSGVYYVDIGTPAPEGKPRSGALEFIDPRTGADMIAVPGAGFGAAKLIRPSNGELIMFPSWVNHCVHPYWGERERISIAFNIRLRTRG
jgi:uncharacterized protein (TIGR02466 family)